MKKVRTLITATTLASILLLSSTFANAGIIVAGLTSDRSSDTKTTDPCTVKTEEKVNDGIIVTDLDGIIVAGFTGIIVAGLTGIIVAGATDEPVNCGIIVAG